MSRIRNIKPGFFTDQDVTELHRDCRLFFIGLWTECDKNGVFEWKPRQLKIKLFSCDLDILSENIETFLDTLQAIDFVRKFDHRGEPFGWVRNFCDHQAISITEQKKGATLAPVPKRWPTRSGHVPDTLQDVEGTPDIGHRTKDIGRRTDDAPPAGAGVVPPPATSQSGKAGQPAWMGKLRDILAECGLSNNNTDCREWFGALTTRAKTKGEAEVRSFFKWAVPFMRSKKPDGDLHLRHAGFLPDEWTTAKQAVEQSA